MSKEDMSLTHHSFHSWEDIVDAYPELKDHPIGSQYKPDIQFTMPFGSNETSILASGKIESGFQEVYLSRPLDPKTFNHYTGQKFAVLGLLAKLGTYHACISYVNK